MEAFETQNKKSAATRAAILKKNPEVRAYIEGKSEKSRLDKQKVLELLAAIAFTSPADFAKITSDGEKQKIVWRIENLPDDVRKAISVIKNTPSGISIETLDRMKAIDLLMKYMGIREGEDCAVIFEGEDKIEE